MAQINSTTGFALLLAGPETNSAANSSKTDRRLLKTDIATAPRDTYVWTAGSGFFAASTGGRTLPTFLFCAILRVYLPMTSPHLSRPVHDIMPTKHARGTCVRNLVVMNLLHLTRAYLSYLALPIPVVRKSNSVMRKQMLI